MAVKTKIAGIAGVVVIVSVVTVVAFLLQSDVVVTAAAPDSPTVNQWGIEVLGIRPTAGNYMLDFRYRVSDPVKAARLAAHDVQPYVVDNATGVKFIVPAPPKLGPMRPLGALVAGKTYWMFFANPGQFIKSGAQVTVVIGNFSIPLTVQ